MNGNTAITTFTSTRRTVMSIDGETVSARTDGTWKELLAAYLSQKDVRSQESLKTYRKALIRFFKWVQESGRQLSGLTKRDILDYKEYLSDDRHCTTQTIALYVIAVRGFYDWAEAEKLYPNIVRGVKTRIDKGHIKRHLNRQQRQEILQYFENISKRDFAIINLILRDGLRTVEVSRANINDIDYIDGQRILRLQGKGYKDKTRWVVLRDHAYQPIREYLDGRPSALASEPLFTCEGHVAAGRRLSPRTIQHICKKGLRAIGLDSHSYSAHSLRHTAGVAIIENGGTLSDVQDVLGHASIDTSRIYLESAKEDIRLKNPAERFLDDIL